MHRASRPPRRRHLVLAAMLVACGTGAAVALVVVPSDRAGGPSSSGGPTTASAPPPSTTTIAPTTTVPALVPDGTYQVGTTSLVALDDAVPAGAPARTVPTTVWYPLAGRGPAPLPGARPLLVFSQGFAEPVSGYAALLGAWASAGFVVAAPTYPHTTPAQPTLDRADIVNHPGDLRAVITAVLDAGNQPGSVLHGLVDADAVGLAGQSDGGDVSLAVADDTCCRDPRVKALAVLSGSEDTAFGGRYFTSPSPPLLVVQGSADPINQPSCSVQVYEGAPPPKYYLDLLGASHLPPYTTPGGDESVVAQVTTDFFEGQLAGDHGEMAAMASEGNVPTVATLTATGAPPPAATGEPCSTAPTTGS